MLGVPAPTLGYMTWIRNAVVPVAMVVFLAACGGSSGSPDQESVSTVSLPESTTSLPPEESTTTTLPDDTSTSVVPADQGTSLTEEARVSTLGLGPVFMGDKIAVVEEKIGASLVPDESGSSRCRYYTVPGGPPGVSFMVAFGRIARIDIEAPSAITTRSGAGIGSTEQEILGLFGDRIEVRPDPLGGDGKYLVFVPRDEKDQNLRVIFVTGPDGVVTSFRTGQLPEVEYAEGCA